MNNVTPLSDEIARQAADPATPLETLASIAASHPAARAAVAANHSAYPGLLEWMAKDPATPADALAALAADHADLHPVIAVHPNAYDGLREWIAVVSPGAAPAVAQVGYGQPGYAQPGQTPAGKPGAFFEPTRNVPLTWSNYRTRIIVTYSLAAFAGVLLQTIAIFAAVSVPSIVVLDVIAYLAVFAAFVVFPGELGRRLIAGGAATVVLVLFSLLTLVAAVRVFPLALPVAAIVAGWFFVRRRPGLSYAFVGAAAVISIILSFCASALTAVVFQYGDSINMSLFLSNFFFAYIPAISIGVGVALGRLIATSRAARQSVLS